MEKNPPILTKDQIEAFRDDGVVHLRKVFDLHWLVLLDQGILRDFESPTGRFVRHTPDDAPAHYWENFWAWSEIPEIGDFLRQSPAAALAGQLLAARRINLVMDNWFYREAGSPGRPPWHHDISYFDFEGSMCVLWLPLQASNRENGITFVRGSHRWGKLFMRTFFSGHEIRDPTRKVRGATYEPPPDIDADPSAYDLVSFDLEAGDCIFFDMRTLHGVLQDRIQTEDAVRFTARFSAEDGIIRYRGDWAKSEREIFEAAGHQDGDALDSAFFPRLWEA